MIIRSLAVAAVALLSTTAAFAADLIIPTSPEPIMESAGFSWEGLYAGVQAGGQFYPANSFGLVGVHAGVNFIVADPILVGVEGSAEWIFNNTGSFGEFFINGRLGAVVTDQVLIYALAGTGIEVNNVGTTFGTYQLGGGVEFAVTDSISVRGQLVGVGFYNDGNANFFDGGKATVGVSYHF
jgi:outer membrane immunogenic protein